jgi:AraC-like DNA-binding protein
MAAIHADIDIGLVRLGGGDRRGGSVVQDDYDLDCPWHHHDMHQVQYAFEGAIELEDATGRHLLPCSLAGWIPAGVTHRDSLRRVRSLSLLLPPKLVPDAGDRIRIIRVPRLMRAMLEEAARWPIGAWSDAVGAAFYEAFGRLAAEWIAGEAPFGLPASADPKVSAAMAYARANLASAAYPLACRAAGMSERSLRRRFRQTAGMTWDDYLRRARLLAGVEALTTTTRSVSAIAADVGYESQSAFAKAFTKLTGATPQAFRRAAS